MACVYIAHQKRLVARIQIRKRSFSFSFFFSLSTSESVHHKNELTLTLANSSWQTDTTQNFYIYYFSVPPTRSHMTDRLGNALLETRACTLHYDALETPISRTSLISLANEMDDVDRAPTGTQPQMATRRPLLLRPRDRWNTVPTAFLIAGTH